MAVVKRVPPRRSGILGSGAIDRNTVECRASALRSCSFESRALQAFVVHSTIAALYLRRDSPKHDDIDSFLSKILREV